MSSWSGPVDPNAQNPVLPNVGVRPGRNQMVFAQIKGAISSENPNIDFSDIEVEVNNIVRRIYDRREWSGLFIRGQVATSGFTFGGSIDVTVGSDQVTGIGTSWTPAIIGQQFRLGLNTPPYNIVALDQTNQILTLEMPWASTSAISAGYFIAQYYYALGNNIRYIHTAKNMLMAWRLWLNYNQQTLDSRDPWRATAFMPVALAQMPPNPNGVYMVELWPVPAIVQSLPFIAAVQPPNLVNDQDALPPAIRADIVVDLGRAWAKTYKGPRWNEYYDAGEAARLRASAEQELLYAMSADEDLYRQNILYESESMNFAPDLLSPERNSMWAINHGVPADPVGY